MSKVNLIAVSKPDTSYTGCDTAEQLVAYSARVSNPANQNNQQTAGKLVRYLIRENHWSPLEMVHMTLEIKTTRDISRQIIRHRSFSFQEFSQRYADPSAQGYPFQLREARTQDSKNRQNSIVTEDKLLAEHWVQQQKKVIDAAQNAYDWAIDNGVAKEQARAVLPEGNTDTTLYMGGTLRSWIHYCDLRRANGTQAEHMVVAEQCWGIIKEQFPDIAAAVDGLSG